MTRLLSLSRPLTIVLCAGFAAAQALGGSMVVEDAATQIDQKLGAIVAKDAKFKDADGKDVAISDYLGKGQPLILNLQYFSCPSLCGRLLQGLVTVLKETPLTVGKDMKVLSVSFDHREKPDLASYKKKAVLGVYGREGAADGWHFLTSDEPNIKMLTGSVGYGFRWNTTKNDFDHRATIIFVSPSGKITRYLSGDSFDEKTFRLAVVEASEGTVGSAMDRFILSCYSYDPLTGTYSAIGPMAMSIGGALTLGGLAILLFVLFRGERRNRRQAVTPVTAS